MQYKYSRIDEDNFKWFAHDMSKASLSGIRLRLGDLRGLHPFTLEFSYPISVIAGANGSGKSTILAMAACAYHNPSANAFRLPERRLPYYTFSDFFVQSSEEVPPEGIELLYRIKYNSWRKNGTCPTGVGDHWMEREKRKGGKWTEYATRARRNVVFLGIQRVVPPSERGVSKSYRYHLRDKAPTAIEEAVKEAVGRVLATEYEQFWVKSHGKYRLPMVRRNGKTYSGFNMGAGENALFEIFYTIFSTPPGTLLVIDEIELGLHESAQRNLVTELKRVCQQRQNQVVCTTHSAAVLTSLPPEARFFVQSYQDKTVITTGISPEYAAAQMAVGKSNELDIYVEDGVAAHLVESALSIELRKRVNVIPIGSASAIVRQLASRFKDRKHSECLAIMDGDQTSKLGSHLSSFMKLLETVSDPASAESWFKDRMSFLPGPYWPERWLVDRLRSGDSGQLARILRVPNNVLISALDAAAVATKHDELRTLSRHLAVEPDHLEGIIFSIALDLPEEVLGSSIKKAKSLLP